MRFLAGVSATGVDAVGKNFAWVTESSETLTELIQVQHGYVAAAGAGGGYWCGLWKLCM